MHTFLPYPDYEASANVLEPKLLQLQRLVALGILDILHEVRSVSDTWRNHPGISMWRGHEPQLAEFGIVLCEVYQPRDHDSAPVQRAIQKHLEWATDGDFSLLKPKWFGDRDFHLSHQSNLIRKNPDWYQQHFPGVPLDLPYVWPEP